VIPPVVEIPVQVPGKVIAEENEVPFGLRANMPVAESVELASNKGLSELIVNLPPELMLEGVKLSPAEEVVLVSVMSPVPVVVIDVEPLINKNPR
jgi:hypothetical protein